jgi:hypothetical protein
VIFETHVASYHFFTGCISAPAVELRNEHHVLKSYSEKRSDWFPPLDNENRVCMLWIM